MTPATITRRLCDDCAGTGIRGARPCITCDRGLVEERQPAPVMTTETRRRRTGGQR